MKKWKPIASIIIVFLLGALAGSLVTHKIYRQRTERIMRNEPGAMGEMIVRRLNDKLDLDAAQLEKLRAIVKETHADIRNLRKQIRPQIEEALTRSQDRVRAILRPDQLEKYEKIIAERKKRRENEENGK